MKILWIDCETTGLSTWRDKIVTISLHYNGKTKTFICNPGCPIPKEASNIHKIYDKDVIDKPNFNYYADQIFNMLNACDAIGGYNIRNFDLPLLNSELLRCGYEVPLKPIVDVYEQAQLLFKSLKLSDIYRVVCGKELNGAHSSSADVEATYELYRIINEKYLNKE